MKYKKSNAWRKDQKVNESNTRKKTEKMLIEEKKEKTIALSQRLIFVLLSETHIVSHF